LACGEAALSGFAAGGLAGASAFSDGFDDALPSGVWPARRDGWSNQERPPDPPFCLSGSGSAGAAGMIGSNRERSDGSYVGRIGGLSGPVEDLPEAGLAGAEEADDWAGAGGCPGLG
jgi:hypothetical protein